MEYIYHATIINALIQLGYSNSIWLFVVVIILTCLFAWISTKTIGVWALNKKTKYAV